MHRKTAFYYFIFQWSLTLLISVLCTYVDVVLYLILFELTIEYDPWL